MELLIHPRLVMAILVHVIVHSLLSAVEEFNCGKAAWHQRFGTAGFCELPFKLMAFGFGVWPHRAHDC